MATIKEIAEKAGVSIGTVDRVIHGRGRVAPDKMKRILKIIDELDYHPNNAAQQLALLKKKIRFTFFLIDPVEHPFYQDIWNGAKKKAEELAQYGIEVEFYLVEKTEIKFDYEELKTDGIVMINLDFLKPVVRWANENNIPVIYYNLPSDEGLAYVGCDYQKAGRIAAGMCALVCQNKGRVGILSEPSLNAASYHDRLKGFCEELREHYPDMQTVDPFLSDKETALEVSAVRLLKLYPDLDAIYLVNPKDYKVCFIIDAIIREAGRDGIKIITNDLSEEQISMLKRGMISATICQDPEYQGAQSLELLYRYAAYNEVPSEKNYYTKLSICISQSI